jgi:transcription termination factor Rho
MTITAQNIKDHGFIFASAIFGERAYKVLDVAEKNFGFEIKTHYNNATFSIMVSKTEGANWRLATGDDF